MARSMRWRWLASTCSRVSECGPRGNSRGASSRLARLCDSTGWNLALSQSVCRKHLVGTKAYGIRRSYPPARREQLEGWPQTGSQPPGLTPPVGEGEAGVFGGAGVAGAAGLGVSLEGAGVDGAVAFSGVAAPPPASVPAAPGVADFSPPLPV